MKQQTLSSQLISYLRQENRWVHKGTIEVMRWKNQKNFTYYLPETVGRTLRELASNNVIEVRDDKNRKSIEYKYIFENVRN